MSIYQATVSAPVNIACMKYWDKRDTKLILPTNSSLSVTLDQDHLRSITISRADPSFEKDRLWPNSKEEEIKDGGLTATCIAEMKRLRKELVEDKAPTNQSSLRQLSTYPASLTITSPLPLGPHLLPPALLHSSPLLLSFMPCPSPSPHSHSSLGKALVLPVAPYLVVLSHGCKELYPQARTPLLYKLLHNLIGRISTPSFAWSPMTKRVPPPLDATYCRNITPASIPYQKRRPRTHENIQQAIPSKDFDTFAKITMANSNQFHAVALDAEPPIFYMNEVSRAIIASVVESNRVSLEKKDIWRWRIPNMLDQMRLSTNVKEIIEMIVRYFPQHQGAFKDVFGLFGGIDAPSGSGNLVDGFNDGVAKKFEVGVVKGLIYTRVGDGPKKLGEEEGLLGNNELPKTLAV